LTIINQFHKDPHLKSILFIPPPFSLSFLILSLPINTIPIPTPYPISTPIQPPGPPILRILFYPHSKHPKPIFFIPFIL
ncbi:QacE family quaternary ammonium compound efflux SMR transporter, partial [Bacillus sp. WP8]|uniref:QacE family quaternary ammonium compound efflux SMR transporter n=1 Tax=Bacillus sp. WP8 TaxID=756828 RepID=UPI00119CF06E